jgi:predicted RNA-binding Zn-ribbon protein involved in translation (DUF1610 family)
MTTATKTLTFSAVAALAQSPQAAEPDNEELARLGWQRVICPACGHDGARGYPRPAPASASEPSRSEKLRAAGYTARLSPFECDECGKHFLSVAILQAHKCSPHSRQAEQREPLTDEQIWSNDEMMAANAQAGLYFHDFTTIVRAVERAHGIGANGGKPAGATGAGEGGQAKGVGE